MSHFAQTLSQASSRTNHEGFPTHVHGLRDQVRNLLRTGTASGTFYVRADQLLQETIDTLRTFGLVDADALAEEAVSARQEGYMRTLPIVALAVLSGLPDKRAFQQAASGVLFIPRDVVQFIEICKSGAIPGVRSLGGCRVAIVRQFLEAISEYHAVKGASSKAVSLRDAVRLAHPRPRDAQMRELLGWLSGHVDGKRVRLNGKLVALEALKQESDPRRQVELIREGGLPFEAVTAAVTRPGQEVWSELLRQAPTFNLLRNLVSFTRHGVFQDEANVDLAVRKLTRDDALRKARILPFRAYQAWKMYSAQPNHNLRIVAALSDMLEQSVANLPDLRGRVALAPDVSGSMQSPVKPGRDGELDWRRCRPDELSCAEVAGIFAAGLLRRCSNARVLPFEFNVVPVALNPRDSVLANARTIGSLGGGGTSLSAPVETLLRERDQVDLFVGLTDNEEWAGRSFYDAWRQYKAEVAPAAKAVLVTVVPTKHRPAPASADDVYFVHGWSDSVMRFVAEVAGGSAPVIH